MKFCANCGSELLENAECPSCTAEAPPTQLVSLRSSAGWLGTMYRSLIIAYSAAGLMFFLSWVIALATDPGSSDTRTNIYFLGLAGGVLINVILSVLAKTKVGLVSAFAAAGFNLWVMPNLVTYLAYDLERRVGFGDFISSMDRTASLLSFIANDPDNFLAGLFGWLTIIGFFLISLSHGPLILIGAIAVGQEAISENLSNSPSNASKETVDSPLIIGAFIASFLVPIAGLVLSLIGIPKWSKYSSRDKGILLAALSISVLSFFLSLAFFILFFGTVTDFLTNF